MTWRPEDWKNPYDTTGATFIPIAIGSLPNAFEAGAEAMLQGLKQNTGAWMTPEQMKLLAPDRKYGYGWLVFIPEEDQQPSRADLHQTTMLLEKLGVEYERKIDLHEGQTEIVFKAYAFNRIADFDHVFYCVFIFDSAGRFLKVGVWQ